MHALALPALDQARLSELASAYLNAEYRWQQEGVWHGMRIGSPAPGIDGEFPDATRFAMISAWDPYSVARDEAENRREDEALRQRLSASPYRFVPAFSAAPDRSWREPSWLVAGIPAGSLDELGRRFGQLGTLYWRRGEPIRLRMYAAAPAGLQSHPDIDWLD